MVKIKILLTFFISISFKSFGQEGLQGKWYMFSRSRVIEFNFSKDSLFTKSLNWDLTTRERNKADTQLIINTVQENGNIYLYHRPLNDTINQVFLWTFKITRPNEQLLIALNTAGKPFNDTSLIRQYITNDHDEKYGSILYSWNEIQRLKQRKKIIDMSVPDFKNYADKILKLKTQIDSLSKLPNAPNDLLYYGYAAMRDIIGQLGYDPLVTSDEFDSFIKSFQNKPETKEVVAKMIK